MTRRPVVGELVQTGFGKGLVCEVRNSGRLLVEVQGRRMVVAERDVSLIAVERGTHRVERTRQRVGPRPQSRRQTGAGVEVDLHGMTVEESLDRALRALNDAFLDDLAEVRFIHGRSGGRIRQALHRWLRDASGVRTFTLDPRNEGVTIVSL